MQQWHGIRAHGSGIVRVTAETREEARERIREQLSRPGRSWYLDRWVADGCMVATVEEKRELVELSCRISRLLYRTQQDNKVQDPPAPG